MPRNPITQGQCRAPASGARPAAAPEGRFRPGTGVWILPAAAGSDPLAGHVLSFNTLTGTYVCVADAEPMRSRFVPARRLSKRFAGETAPGVAGYCP
jgi:hypothetical protein